MHVRCPHCHNPIEIIDSSLRDIPCPSCGSSFSLISDETVSFKQQQTTLGHFELVEKIGVGGFGTVWKARDTDLERTVAIKVPRKDQLTEQDTELFFREARAAAQLNHPSIVGVHEVGRDNDTIYIVSDFIDGLTLADWLTGQQPTIRESVGLVAKIADALHAAHEQGIVHRDLKPSNIMLDEDGEPHVMDFGLAKREAGEVTMTVDGQVIGTPAYMAPEQARGDAHTADRRADVYALGVILFELLTGEKPFRGNTRMILHQVLNEEAPSPRKLNSNVPRDLDTITLRCLEKEAGERFQTADGLSADLSRHLNDEPVESRPVGGVERGARWCRRNPVVASLGVCIAVLLVVGISVVTGLWITAEANARDASTFAEKYRVEAENANQLAKQEAEARKTAEAEKGRADANSERAQSVVDEFFTEVSESMELLRGTPGTQRLRVKLLEKAERYYESFLAENELSAIRSQLATVSLRLGVIQRVMGKMEKAKASMRRSLEIYKELAETSPTNPAYQNFVTMAHNNLGIAYEITGHLQEAAQHYTKARPILKMLVSKYPTDDEYQIGLAGAYSNIGSIHERTGDAHQAAEQYEQAHDIFTNLFNETPTAENQNRMAGSLSNLSGVYMAKGDPSEAIRQLKLAIKIQKDLVDMYKRNSEYQERLANSYYNLANICLKLEEFVDAETRYKQAIGIQNVLVEQNPTVGEYQYQLTNSYNNLGETFRGSGKRDEAIKQYNLAIEIQERLVGESPTVIGPQLGLAGSCVNLAIIHRAAGEHLVAISLLQKAKQNLNVVLKTSPDDAVANQFMRNAIIVETRAYNARAWLLATSPRPSERNGTESVKNATSACKLTQWQNYECLTTLAAAHAEAGDFDEAIKYQHQAIKLAPNSKKPNLEQRLKLYEEKKPYREQPKSTEVKSN